MYSPRSFRRRSGNTTKQRKIQGDFATLHKVLVDFSNTFETSRYSFDFYRTKSKKQNTFSSQKNDDQQFVSVHHLYVNMFKQFTTRKQHLYNPKYT